MEFYLVGARLHVFRLQPLEGGHVDMADQSVQFVGGILVLVAHTSKTNANTEGNIPENTINF